MKMNAMTVEELRGHPGYERWMELKHGEIMPFVQEEFSQKSALLRAYLYGNLLLLLVMAGLMGWQAAKGVISIWGSLQYWGLGLAAALTLLIPVHEGIHGLAYKLAGAPRVRYGADIRKFVFYAMADRFVVDSRRFYFIALAPFALIGIFALAPIFYVSLNYQWFLAGVFMMHVGSCAGDFAMINFFLRHREEDLHTYDDVKQGVSYFYRKKPPELE